MQKIHGRKKLFLYACSGLGVNMLNLIVGTYLCSALLVGGFEAHLSEWTYISRDLVVAGLWSVLILAAKIIDGLIDLPFSHMADNFRSRFGRRRPMILIGFVPMIIAYLLFLVPIDKSATVLNTVWFALLLFIFYGCYTLTMITYYATFAEVTESSEDLVFVSNVKSVCDVVYFIFGYALIPAFVSMNLNIRVVALIFLPLSLTMAIPFFLLREDDLRKKEIEPKNDGERVTFVKSFLFTAKDKPFIAWLFVLAVMNMGLQLFLSGINEFFSTTGLNMTFIMASCFVPVPVTIMLYNKIVNKKGLGFAYRYILLVYSIGMGLMGLCNIIKGAALFPFAIGCSLIVSVSIGAFFSVTYTVPSDRAAKRQVEGCAASSMYYAIQGLFEALSAGLGSGIILVFLKQSGYISYMTVIVAVFCMLAFVFSLFLPKCIQTIGKSEK